MVAPTAGEIVVIPFPFSDLTQSKVRPALCLAVAGRGDYVLCQITSQPYGDPLALKIDDQDFASGGLHVESFVRPGKLSGGQDCPPYGIIELTHYPDCGWT